MLSVFDNRDLVAHGGHPRWVRLVILGFLGPFFFSTTSIVFITPRPLSFAFASHASCNLTICLMMATHSHQEDTRADRQRFAVCDGFGARRHRLEERTNTPRSMGDERDQTAPRTCLSALAPSTTLSPSVAAGVPTRRSLARTLGHTSWCNLLTWYSEQRPQLLSRQCFTDKPLFVAQQPTRYLPRRHGSPPRPRLAEERPRDRRRPGGGPRPPQVTEIFPVLLHEKVPLGAQGERCAVR